MMKNIFKNLKDRSKIALWSFCIYHTEYPVEIADLIREVKEQQKQTKVPAQVKKDKKTVSYRLASWAVEKIVGYYPDITLNFGSWMRKNYENVAKACVARFPSNIDREELRESNLNLVKRHTNLSCDIFNKDGTQKRPPVIVEMPLRNVYEPGKFASGQMYTKEFRINFAKVLYETHYIPLETLAKEINMSRRQLTKEFVKLGVVIKSRGRSKK